MVHRRGAEIPDDRLLAAHQKREAAKLVPLPLADLGGGHIANVVHVEKEQRPAFRLLKRLSARVQVDSVAIGENRTRPSKSTFM